MKIILDANVLLQSLGKSSKYRPIWNAYLDEKYRLLISNSILLEYEEVLNEKTTNTVAVNVINLIIEAIHTEHLIVYYEWNAIKRDPDDNKYFDAAVSGNADYIVTNDKHFNDIKRLIFPEVKIISGEKFLNLLKTNPGA